MDKEIEDIIKKNLPEQVGEVLKKRLEKANQDEIKLKQLEETLVSKNLDISRFEDTIAEYQEFNGRNSKLDIREAQLDRDERNLKIRTLEHSLACETEKTQFTKDVALGLVRNTNYRKTIFDNENQAGYQGVDGNWVQPMPINKNLTENDSAD